MRTTQINNAPAAGLPESSERRGRRAALLFTAFEPSGDDHASAVIAELRARHPDLPIFAWGGPKMEAAGATLVERTGDDAVMGMPGLAKIREHQRINERIDKWLGENKNSDTPVVLHIPVDSPAANTPICKISRQHGLKIVHLVAPQIWAWGRWRIGTLRKVTDQLLCVLPFEERFFTRRGVPARFIGHFLFDRPVDPFELDRRSAGFPAGSPKLAMMPGSRPKELERHFPLMLEAFQKLKRDYPQIVGVVACTNPRVETQLREAAQAIAGGWPEGLRTVVGDTDAVVRWCDMALVKSGTVTMQVARQLRPMIIFYHKANPVMVAIMRLVVATKLFSLPNVIAARRIIPELIPYQGNADRLVRALRSVIDSAAERDRQKRELAAVIDKFRGRHARVLAANAIEEFAGISVPPRS